MTQQRTEPRIEPNASSKFIRHAGNLFGTDAGGLATWISVDGSEAADTEAGVINSAVGATIGVFVAAGVFVYRKVKRNSKSIEPLDDINNPWNARVKAGVVFGEGIGRGLFAALPIPLAEKPLLVLGSAVGGFLGGIVAFLIPGWKPSDQEPEQKSQLNPWSERIRSGAMYGSAFGIAIAALLFSSMGFWSISAFILLGAGIGAALGSVIAYSLNDQHFFDQSPEHLEKSAVLDRTQNPWSKRIRAGIQWGACLGILLGALFPGLGLGLSATLSVLVGGALFSVLGGIVSLVVEPLVTSGIKKVLDKDYRTVNAWGPRCRAGVAFGTCVGMFFGCLAFPGFVGATVGGAIGGLAGGLLAIVIEPLFLFLSYLRNNKADYESVGSDDPNYITPNPWSERCRTGTLVLGALGALIGYFLFPPFGIFLGGAIGGILGGVIGFILPSKEVVPSVPDGAEGYQHVGVGEEASLNTQTGNFIESPLLKKGAGERSETGDFWIASAAMQPRNDTLLTL